MASQSLRPLTERQHDAIQRMIRQRHLPEGLVIPKLDAMLGGEAVSRADVDLVFNLLLAFPRDNGEAVAPGVYHHNGTTFRVKSNRAGTNVYAQRATPSGGWEYAPGAVFDLSPEERKGD